jgi:glutamate/tyrosine decarboxylase-like PLP-dependent enzyme
LNAFTPPALPSSALFPDRESRQAVEDFLRAALQGSIERVSSGPVGPDIDMTAFRQALDGFDFDAPHELSSTLAWVIEQLEHGVVHMTHPRYFGLFNPSPAFAAQCADRIAAAFNPQLATATTSPVAVEIEAHVIRAVAQRAGLPSGSSGHFTTGGSEANFTALVCALTHAEPSYGRDGVRAFAGPPTLYVSEDAHVAWFKIAHQSGIGRGYVRVIATDAAGRMDMAALAAAIARDKADGCIPVMIAATAGTTGAGMIDPLPDCAGIARDFGVWLHVDAAWGGALIVSDQRRCALMGIENADSVTIDAHKWLAMTMGCGIFLTRHPDVLADSFHVAASFMPSNARHLDPYVTSAQWSRRFAGLRLFVTLAATGWQGFADHVENAIGLTSLLKAEMTARGWRAANESGMAVLCLDPPQDFPAAATIARAVVASNLAWVSVATFGGRDVVRVCITNGQTTRHDIVALADLLHELGSGLRQDGDTSPS